MSESATYIPPGYPAPPTLCVEKVGSGIGKSKIEKAFLLGFCVSRVGFNAEFLSKDLAPKSLFDRTTAGAPVIFSEIVENLCDLPEWATLRKDMLILLEDGCH